MNFDNKVVLITGGGTGIGRETAVRFVNHGARVMVVGRRQEPLESLANEFPDAIDYVQGDLAKADDRKRMIQTTIDRFERLDILVNNAAVLHLRPFEATTDEELTEAFNINLLAPIALTREAVPHLIKTKGSVVNVSAAVSRGVLEGVATFAVMKAGLNHATRYMAKELGHYGIRANVVAPGLTQTGLSDFIIDNHGDEIVSWTPLKRLGRPEGIARMILLISSEDAAWTTGQVIGSSGGLMKF